MRRVAIPVVIASILVGCHDRALRPPCAGAACAADCPRDATTDASGRCACVRGHVDVLGACVPLAVADAYCMAPARANAAGGCEPPVCASAEAVDLEGGCLPLASLARGGARTCSAKSALVVDDRRAVCVPADAACPRGTRAQGGTCTSPPSCPPGTLLTRDACRPVVLRSARGAPVVDVGLWAALVLGTDGGAGSDDLCRPLAARPTAFGLAPGDDLSLRIRIALAVPDEDISRVHAAVRATSTAGHALPAGSVAWLDRAVQSLLEPLRGLGGEASTAMVELEVRCAISSL